MPHHMPHPAPHTPGCIPAPHTEWLGKDFDALIIDINVPGGPFDVFDGALAPCCWPPAAGLSCCWPTRGGGGLVGMQQFPGSLQQIFQALFTQFPGDTLEDQFEKFINLGDDRNIVEVYVAGAAVKLGDTFLGPGSHLGHPGQA
ncbi:guanine aminohydrolase [Haematococcus lacustris]|uniref:Guanine aminohydrolase n=1 Tax=Haematococcus lacustris TaxID=44745 RepID=A0A6A0AFA3_HAELA|nr:guanine aminohydrolase [Haematococcus lacustris]